MSENLPALNVENDLQMGAILLKGGLLPAHFKTVEAVVTAIWYGRELGMSPIRAIQSINVIQGKPTLDAQALKAIAIKNGGKFETLEWTIQKCTIKGTRGDWTETITFSMEDAQLQGLAGKDNWKRMPKAMLYARCVSILIRNMFADVIGGLYGREEMEDAIDITPPSDKPKLSTGDGAPVPMPKKPSQKTTEPDGNSYAYNINHVPAHKLQNAKLLLAKAGAVELSTGVYKSPRKVLKLADYEVKSEQMDEPDESYLDYVEGYDNEPEQEDLNI